MSSVGFIILRHVNNETTNKYWTLCYESIRKQYPENHILIIDDNSDYRFVSLHHNLYKTTIIDSEYNGRGEVLPYYYFLHNKLFEVAVIIHDSVFLQKHIDFSVDKYKIIWDFEHHWDQIEDESIMINTYNDPELVAFYKDKSLWTGCFGGMSIITHDFLVELDGKYPISNLLDLVLTRFNRCSFERVIACLLQKTYKNNNTTLLGNIHKYMPWAVDFAYIEKCKHLPMIKIWTGR